MVIKITYPVNRFCYSPLIHLASSTSPFITTFYGIFSRSGSQITSKSFHLMNDQHSCPTQCSLQITCSLLNVKSILSTMRCLIKIVVIFFSHSSSLKERQLRVVSDSISHQWNIRIMFVHLLLLKSSNNRRDSQTSVETNAIVINTIHLEDHRLC